MTNETPKVEKLSDMIDYQEGAVVSRTLHKRDTGTITLFAFDAGEGLSEHVAPFTAMVTVLDGRAEITISDEAYTLEAGDMIMMPENEPHAVRALERFKMLLVMIRS